ncbi:universal stress protein [Chryseolinea sp. H1M3-3]|uniref:universal stress protein n=1 Tax=Chryseolinea sp. H1M3-3 TaxID=3034144 RepID=UPI0023EC4499|nr:universal stress protein [Chryseolinea sp. H1M3-3]
MKRILVPCDFSKPSKEAYKFALELAMVSKGEIFVVHAVELPLMYETAFGIQPYPADPELVKKMDAQANDAFQKMKQAYYSPVPIAIHFTLTYDFVLPSLRAFIQENAIDLVVMGTHGSSGLEEFLIGSNTEKVVRFSPVPVLSVRTAKGYGGIQNIVFPSTLALNQTDLVQHVVSLQEFFKAKLHIVFINTPENFKTDEEGRSMLEEYAKHYNLKNYTLNFKNNFSERDGILDFAEDIKADMIAMATHSRKGLKHFFLGSVAESVVNHLDCPVWTYSIKQ